MSSNARWCSALSQAQVGRGLAVAVCVSVSACSADVTRFDFPAFNVADDNAPTGALPGSPGYAQRPGQNVDVVPGTPPRGVGAPNQPPAPVYGSSYPGERFAARGDAPQTAPLPPIVPELRPATQPEPSYGGERARQGLAPERAPIAAREPSPQAKAAGDTIEVGQGDTLYGLSKRYGVALADLIEANALHHGASLKPGQQIVLPPGTLARQARREARAKPAVAVVPVAKVALTPVGAVETNAAPRAPENPAAEPPRAAPPSAASAPGEWEGRHTIKNGESLYGIARQQHVSLAELQRVNGIDSPLRVKVGTTLKVPGTAAGSASGSAPAPAVTLAPEAPAAAKIINQPTERKQLAARSDQVSDAEPVAAPAPSSAADTSSGRFRWPARGRVIAGYGRRPDGTHNDGINLALPQGAEVHASEGGKVAYAGNELKGYGNLILIRHDNGWVSAYAHNEQLLVKRDDQVQRGQVIAKAGKTGSVDQPQLHFELRQGSKPVDPLLHLEKN